MLQIHKSAPVGALERVGGVLLPPCVASFASKDLGAEQTLGWGFGGGFLLLLSLFFLTRTVKKEKMDSEKSSLSTIQ